jgi:hypothetical protein
VSALSKVNYNRNGGNYCQYFSFLSLSLKAFDDIKLGIILLRFNLSIGSDTITYVLQTFETAYFLNLGI